MDAFRQLQVLSLLTMALMFAPMAVPPLRRYTGWLQRAAFLLYFIGGLAVFMVWQLAG